MTLHITRTINETSFALAFMDATALVLDAISLIGGERKVKLEWAAGRLNTAMLYADTTEEKLLARQLKGLLAVYEQKGLNV